MDDEADFSGIAKRRTATGQFKTGHSGNPRGRPRSKHQRALSTREGIRDVLAVTEEVVPVRTSGGVQMMSFNKANLLSMRAKAAQGHAPSQRYLDKAHKEAIKALEKLNLPLTQLLESNEKRAVQKSTDCLSPSEWKHLNIVRKFTWRM